MNVKNHGYKPLMDFLTVSKSGIHGLGLFITKDKSSGLFLGVSHVGTKIPYFDRDLIRTPLGGFINHSDNANLDFRVIDEKEGTYGVYLSRDVKAGEELTLNYCKALCGITDECEKEV